MPQRTQMRDQRAGSRGIAQHQRNYRMLARQCLEPEPRQPGLEARRHGAQVIEQPAPDRTIEQVDRLPGRGGLGWRDRIGIDVER